MSHSAPRGRLRLDAQALTYLAMSWGASAIALTGLLVPQLVDPHGPLLGLGVGVFLASGAWVLWSGRVTRRSAHPLTAAAILSGLALVLCVQDPLARSLASTWGLLIPVQMSSSLSRRATAGYGLVCAGEAAALVGVVPGNPILVGLRGVTIVGVISLALLHVVLLRRELDAALDRANHLATSDTLTRLLNRRGLADRFEALARSTARRRELLAVVVFDLDHFKRINDTMGHATGDAVLVAVTGSLVTGARAGDLLVRLGGEEIALVGAVSGVEEAAALAERLRLLVRRDAGAWDLTTSAGVAVARVPDAWVPGAWVPGAWGAHGEAELLAGLLAEADRCLYLAKANGRDQVVGPEQPVGGVLGVPAGAPGGSGQ